MDVYFEICTVERTESCLSSVVTMIVSGPVALRGQGDLNSAKAFDASTGIAIPAIAKDLVAFMLTT
jgi:hypothetical protein